jgi:RNA polymerase sigma factor (sigma-70 family)
MWAVSDYAASPAAAPSGHPLPRGPLRLVGDERLARLAAAGGERAFAVLYERHHQGLYRYCRAIVRHDEDAADVLQTTMARALAALARGVPDAPMKPWLFRIAHNEAISLLRRRRPTTDLDEAPELEGRRIEDKVEERSRLATLVADLNELPDRQRGALVMRELSGLSHEEIAAALDVPVSAAKQAIFDARSGLQDFAKGRAMQCADVQRIISERDGRMLRGRPLRAHLRACGSCRALRDAIGTRRSDLAALAPPLPATASAGLLSGILGGGGHGGAGGLISGVSAKAAAGAMTGKALAGAAVVATVAVGTAQVVPHASVPADRDPLRAPAALTPTASAPAAPAPAARARALGSPGGTAAVSSTAQRARDARAQKAAHRDRAGTRVAAPAATRDAAGWARPGRHSKGGSSSASRQGPTARASRPGRRPAASHPAAARRPVTPARPARGKPTTPASTHAPARPSAPAGTRPATPSPPAHRPPAGAGGSTTGTGDRATPVAPSAPSAGPVPAAPAPAPHAAAAPGAPPAGTPSPSRGG